jgi:hypothetical protein
VAVEAPFVGVNGEARWAHGRLGGGDACEEQGREHGEGAAECRTLVILRIELVAADEHGRILLVRLRAG